MQANCRGVDGEIEENTIRIPNSVGESQVRRQGQAGIGQNVVHPPVSFPEFALWVVFLIIRFRSM